MDVIINRTCNEIPAGSLPLPTQGHYLTNTLVALGYDAAYPPLADLLRRSHQLEGNWLVASPVHWEATHNDAMMVAVGDALGLDDKRSKIWFAEVAQLLHEDGLTLVYHSPDLWLVHAGEKAAMPCPSLKAMLHQSMMPALESMGQSMFWQRLITELQMFMGTHPLNSAKDAVLPVNGLWFWGGGELNASQAKPLISNDALLQTVFPECMPYHEGQLLPKNSVVVLADEPVPGSSLLKQTAKIKRTNWYWNDVAYQCLRPSWWTRLWTR